MAAVSALMALYIPVLVGEAIDYVVAPGQVDFAAIGKVLVQMAVFIAVTALAQWIMNVCNNKITYDVVRDIRKEAFDKI